MRCPSALLTGTGTTHVTRCRLPDRDHNVHVESLGRAGLAWTDASPGAFRTGGPVNPFGPRIVRGDRWLTGDPFPGYVRPAEDPAPRVEVIKHDRCANILCPNRAHEGQFSTLTLRGRSGAKQNLALIMCAGCAEALMKEVR